MKHNYALAPIQKTHKLNKSCLKLGKQEVKKICMNPSSVHVCTSLLVQHHHCVDASLSALETQESYEFRTSEKMTDRFIFLKDCK